MGATIPAKVRAMPVFLALKLIGVGAVLAGVLWLVDEIGDRREAKVRAAIAAEVAAANARAAQAEAKWRAEYEAAELDRKKAMDDALASVRQMAAGTCEMSDETRQALNRINARQGRR